MVEWITEGMKPGELAIIASGTDCGRSIFDYYSNSTDYSYIVPATGSHWATWHNRCMELEEWCRVNISMKYATWERSLNKFTFYKKKITCNSC